MPTTPEAVISHPSGHARRTPDKAAFIMEPQGLVVTYAELEARSNRAAHFFRAQGLAIGDGLMIMLGNTDYVFELIWGAQRSGLRYTTVSSKLATQEIEYILRDCGARLMVTASDIATVDELPALLPGVALFNVGGERPGFQRYETAVADLPTTPIPDQACGHDLLYSSGTTGRPKGVVRQAVPGRAFDDEDSTITLARQVYGFSENTIYLSPAPLYHAAPLHWSCATMRAGGTVIVMERFDPELALALIEKHHINTGQFVPTHFVRFLKLPQAVRDRYDISSMKTAIHAAAPCPIPTKQAMIDWWGPVLWEYYSGTEAVGITLITASDWLRKKGSVGRPIFGEIKICDEAGDLLPAGEIGTVFFASQTKVRYHNDPTTSASVVNKHGWATMGDVGHVDDEGFLFLSDRKSFMIISGGVNIYPQEIENVLIQHPQVADVAVFGIPCSEMGEKVLAVVQPATSAKPGPALAEELMAFARASLSHVKAPRQIDFMAELPRQENGKLYKRILRDKYWSGRSLVT